MRVAGCCAYKAIQVVDFNDVKVHHSQLAQPGCSETHKDIEPDTTSPPLRGLSAGRDRTAAARPVGHARSGEPVGPPRHFHPETRAARDPRSGRSAATLPGPLPRPDGRVRSRVPFFLSRQPSFETARQIAGRLDDSRQRLLPLHQRPIRLLPDQDREPRQLRGQARRPPPCLAARRDLTRLAPPRLQAGRPTPDSPHTSPPPASTPCRRRCPSSTRVRKSREYATISALLPAGVPRPSARYK